MSVLEVSSVRSAFVPFSKSAIEGSIPSRFEEQAERHPDRLAVKAETTSWTYAELNRIANRIAHGILDARGSIVEPVVLALEQGPLLIATILGTLKAGKIYVPVDADLPPQRIREVMEDSQAGLIPGGTRAARSDGPFAGVSVLAAQDLADRSSSHNPALPIGPEAAAYIYYTSGSTGRPKGVFDLHRNVLHNIRRYTNSLQISPDDRLTLLQRPSFSGAVSSLFGALLNGAAVFPFDVAHEGVDRVAPWLAREAITIYHSVPALFRMVAARIGPLPELRLIRLEGDQASVTDVELFRSRFSRQAVLVNGLGATECGLVRQYFIGFDTPTPDGLVPVGFPVEDMSVRVVDETGNDVRTGDVGEMCVRSRYLAPGYWRRPDLTAAAFASDETDPGERLYRTGDLGRLRSDGCLDYLGRRDRRVKIRGQLVEIADVEAALVAMPDVREAAVVVREDGGVEPRLVAYIVPAPHRAPTHGALRHELAARLAPPSVPSWFVTLDSLPLSAHGKVDRNDLPPPNAMRPVLDRTFVAPQTLLQSQLASVWERVLGVSPVGISDDFFDLGGDSLLALTMMSDVERELGRTVPMSVLLTGATVERLADAIQTEARDLSAAVVPIQPGNGQRPFFFLHGDYLSGGFYCSRLAGYIGADRPFYALPPCGLDGGRVPESYRAMAKRHVGAMRKIQPDGPYRLGGLCNGGLIAYEMARLLEDDGQQVDALVMVAAIPASATTARTISWRRIASRLIAVARSLPSKARRVARRLVRPEIAAPSIAVESSERRRIIREAFLRLDDGYRPGEYRGRVTLLWPTDDPLSPRQAIERWSSVAPQVDVRSVPGTHFTCLTDHAASAADALRECLQGAPDVADATRPASTLTFRAPGGIA